MADNKARMLAGGGVAAAILVIAAGAMLGAPGAGRGWLGAASLVSGGATGAIVLMLMFRLIPGAWRESLRPPLVALSAVAALGLLAMLPVLAAPREVYEWAIHPPGGARGVLMSPIFFMLRSIVWLVLLAGLAWRLRKPPTPVISTIGLLVLIPFSTLIIDDWLMSLDKEFSSSGFGLYILAIWINFALSLAVAATHNADLKHRAVGAGVLLTSIMIWAYLGFMQYFIAWSGDLPANVGWYYLRHGPVWVTVLLLVILLRATPGLALIIGPVRRSRRALTVVALSAAAAAPIEMAWLVLPGSKADATTGLLYVCACAALGIAGLGMWRLALPEAQA